MNSQKPKTCQALDPLPKLPPISKFSKIEICAYVTKLVLLQNGKIYFVWRVRKKISGYFSILCFRGKNACFYCCNSFDKGGGNREPKGLELQQWLWRRGPHHLHLLSAPQCRPLLNTKCLQVSLLLHLPVRSTWASSLKPIARQQNPHYICGSGPIMLLNLRLPPISQQARVDYSSPVSQVKEEN